MTAIPLAPMPPFAQFFHAVWGYEPFPWQAMLAERIAEGAWPKALDLPTAAGKTACIDAAVYALAAQAGRALADRTAPRRIWFVVDRRIVVDEANERARTLADRLQAAEDGPLRAIADRLRQVSGTRMPLAVARLRGGVLLDDRFVRVPSQPAVITSTVDQLGSRLLFRGYGGSQRVAPIHAGLAGNDSLILLDEAHCSVPFLQTLERVESYRNGNWAAQPIALPFAFATLSATPPPEIPPESVFPGAARKAALAHPALERRLQASKPAELVRLKRTRQPGTDALIEAAVERAVEMVREGGRRRVAIVVNRVGTAERLSEELRGALAAGESDVVLLTGRLRPLERDQLVGDWKPFLRARDPKEHARPVILVSTQCIEVGADFSFDALLTECASLDALRQRFGRLNRMGSAEHAPAVVLAREEDLKDSADDPIYGDALRLTWGLLSELASQAAAGDRAPKFVDFGFAALDAALAGIDEEKRAACLAPHADAPVLLPAHLDLLCQTAPAPCPEPDISLYLHGKGRGVPEVRVLWRGDLDPAATESWIETVAMCPPVAVESVSVPLYRLRRWLEEVAEPDESGDIEGGVAPTEERTASEKIRPCLVWRGRRPGQSTVAESTDKILPGDTVVLPAEYGTAGLAQVLPDSEHKRGLGRGRLDLWEWALEAAGKASALRIRHDLLGPWKDYAPVAELLDVAEPVGWDRERLQDALRQVIQPEAEGDSERPPLPDWLIATVKALLRGFRVEGHPAGGLILSARGVGRVESESDPFADDDDLTSIAGRMVSLAEHSGQVARLARDAARHCLPDEYWGPVELAAQWHDAGKLDERFQLLLHHGSEVETAAGMVLAKSEDVPLSRAQRCEIREASGLPEDFRHEMLSLQLAEGHANLPDDTGAAELTLHLIASHHGHARPFAPVSTDPNPPGIYGEVAGIRVSLPPEVRAGLIPAHRLDSGVAERFWQLTRRHGWWGLAFVEAILRLADWRASEIAPAQGDSGEGES